MKYKTPFAVSNNKEAIRFVIILFIAYILFTQGNLFMNSVTSPGGRFYNAFIDQYLDYIHALRVVLIKPAVAIINLFGFYSIHNEMDILVVNGPILRVEYSCLGLGIMSFLAAFIIAFPAPLKPKIRMFITGILTIYILNVLRLAGLGILMGMFRSQRRYFHYHHEIFNILVYIIIFFMLYRWIKKYTEPLPAKK